MKTFSVIVTRDITESCVISVTAENRSLAEAKALEMAASPICYKKYGICWETDEGNEPKDPYITGCEEEEND